MKSGIKMAFIAIEEPEKNQASNAEVITEKIASPYKEQSADPHSYNRKLEEEGSADVPKAKVYTTSPNPQAKEPELDN